MNSWVKNNDVEFSSEAGLDTLTGLLAPDFFYQKLIDLCAQSDRVAMPLALIGIRLKPNLRDLPEAEIAILTMSKVLAKSMRIGESLTRVSEDGFWLLALAAPPEFDRLKARLFAGAAALGVGDDFEIFALARKRSWRWREWVNEMDLIFF